MFCVTVHFSLQAGAEQRFLPMVRDNARRSLEDEPGCRRFDVCHEPSQPTQVFLYELYDDRAAFDAHLATPHFKAFDAACRDLVAGKEVATYSEVWQ